MSRAGLALIVIGGMAAFDATAYSGGAAEGTVEIRLTDHAAGIGAFVALHVSLAEIAVHRRGAPRRDGWTIVAERTTSVDIVHLKDGRWAAVAHGRLDAGAYDAVRVRFAQLEGRFRQGREHSVTGDDAVIATPLTVPPRGFQAVLLDLYVEDQTDHEPPRFIVKVRRAEPRAH